MHAPVAERRLSECAFIIDLLNIARSIFEFFAELLHRYSVLITVFKIEKVLFRNDISYKRKGEKETISKIMVTGMISFLPIVVSCAWCGTFH